MTAPGRRLLPFLLLSAVAHAAALWPARAFLQWPSQPRAGGALHLELVREIPAPSARPPAAAAHPRPRSSRARRPVVLTAKKALLAMPPMAPKPVSGPRATQTARNAPADARTVTGAPSQARAAAQVRAAIQREFARYFVYPELARERGWQGQVLLAFRVQADGHLDHLQVARSCGYTLLDRSALDALRQVARVESSDGLPGRALEVQLPVVYRLTEN